MTKCFQNRGYPSQMINNAYARALVTDKLFVTRLPHPDPDIGALHFLHLLPDLGTSFIRDWTW